MSRALTPGERGPWTWGAGPQILIVHTHGRRGQRPDGRGLPRKPRRPQICTTDCTTTWCGWERRWPPFFRAHGFGVGPPTPPLYDYPPTTGAYDRSGAAVEQWLSKYARRSRSCWTFHRDALVGNAGQVYKMVCPGGGAEGRPGDAGGWALTAGGKSTPDGGANLAFRRAAPAGPWTRG